MAQFHSPKSGRKADFRAFGDGIRPREIIFGQDLVKFDHFDQARPDFLAGI